MGSELRVLLITAASIGFFHTLFGPDHYLPFVMMSWARKWSAGKTSLITFLCGIGHVASSVVLGLIGVSIGMALKKLELIESVRGDIAAWLLIGFGLAYTAWALRRLYRGKAHAHIHAHQDAGDHAHVHTHFDEHAHVHDAQATVSIAPWTLFVIFVLGPCEPLIPLLMYPAAEIGYWGVVLVALVFSIFTIGTMLATVLIAGYGVSFLPLARVQRYTHLLAGASITLCGLAIVFLGL